MYCTQTHPLAIFIYWSERKQITVHYHRLHAHKSVCTHKGAWIILASGEFIILFYGAGRRWGVVLWRCLWYRGSVCALVRKEAPVRSIHPLRRFPAECDVRVGKWAGPRILCLLWIWHELGPRPLWMWWMYYLIFLSLLTSFCRRHADSLSLSGWNNISSLAFGFWWSIIMAVIIESHHEDLSHHRHANERCCILSTRESTAKHRFKWTLLINMAEDGT